MRKDWEAEEVRGKHPGTEQHNEDSEMYPEWGINIESHSKTIKGAGRRRGKAFAQSNKDSILTSSPAPALPGNPEAGSGADPLPITPRLCF